MGFTPANPTVPAGSISDHYREQLFLNGASYETALPDPVAPPALVSAAGALPDGLYYVGYAWVSANGESRVSPLASILVTVASQITVTPPGLPGGVTNVNYYISQGAGGQNPQELAQVGQNAGAAFVINAFPAAGSPASLSQASGDSDDYRTNAVSPGVPTKVGRNRDVTAYAAQQTDDSWVMHVRTNGKYV